MTEIGHLIPSEPCGAHFISYDTGVKPEIANGVGVSGLVDCTHKVIFEKNSFTGHDVMILTGAHDYNRFGEERKRVGGGGPVTIKEGAWLASRCIILGGVTVGKHAVVCAGAVVTKDIPDYQMWGGVPARFIKHIKHT